jgi:hypothetical protein
MSITKENVTIQDIQSISKDMNIILNKEQEQNILSEYNKEVMDKGESWNELVRILITKHETIRVLKGLNK